jgi:ArsR family transcriptional regulator, arsenate/arsenite/antimonite-responsive transcriptional repressor
MDITTTPPLVAALSALADPTRLGAMRVLWGGGEHCACELIDTLGATQSRVSRHMQALTKAGLVLARRDGNWVRYRINPDLADEMAAVLDAVMHATPALPAAKIGCVA